MVKLRENEDAVSPVIGVILMVAVTVILAAVIAAYVFGMAGTVDTKNKVVAATASAHADGDGNKVIYITYHGGPDADLVKEVSYTVNEGSPEPLTGSGGSSLAVGAVAKVDDTTHTLTGGKDHVVATARFKDASSQVILDTFV
ncbi:MAG: type IV pilin [Methanomicrobiales archaeon]|nr:type IV pilin [Methanomicrobiales archaeon]